MNASPPQPQRTVRILGTHGVPAAYGGFETAAEHVGLHLRRHGWRVIVYCQAPGRGPTTVDEWRGLERVTIPESRDGWLGTASFDFKSIAHTLKNAGPDDVCLTFGYNTGVFNIAQRLRRIPNVINMDGMEWTRARWGVARQGILLANERFSGLVGNVLIADHPEIARYLRRHFGARRVMTITYGAVAVHDAPAQPVEAMGLTRGRYATVICRPIPENSLLEIVTAWSASRRDMPLVILGDFSADDPYHRAVQDAAGDEVRFPGAIYDPHVVSSLRFHSAVYLHGHTVGGTNPSLVEAMAAHNPVVAHDNVYNRWVAGPGAKYFQDAASLDGVLTALLADPSARAQMGQASFSRFEEAFTWDRIGGQYEQALLRSMRPRPSAVALAYGPSGQTVERLES
jgi:glycosyltransferase involved in cell wall biosynthesis